MFRKILTLAILIGVLIGATYSSFFVNAMTVDGNDDWTFFLVDNLLENVGRGTSIAIDSNGYPHMSYFDRTTLSLKYARWSGNNWVIKTVDSPVAIFNSIAIDSNDRPHIGYMYYTTYPSKMCLKYTVWTGSEWEKNIVDSNRISGWLVHLVLDPNDIPHMSYAVNDDPSEYHSWVGGDLKHAWLNETIWETETVEIFCWNENSIDITSDNEVCIAFDKLYPAQPPSTYALLKFAKKTNSVWDIITVDPSSHRYGEVSLVIDSNLGPHISYCVLESKNQSTTSPFLVHPLSGEDPVGISNNTILKYARFVNDEWELYIVADTEGSNGFKNSIALNSTSIPQISYTYYNFTKDKINSDDYQLKYASFFDVEPEPYWITYLVGKGRNRYGYYNSLAFDSENNPHISYYRNYMAGGLMYVTKANFTHSPNTPSIPDGPTYGIVGIEYNYSTVASDQDGDNISYGWDWDGDDMEDEWSDWYSSGDTCNMSYSWQEPGVYAVGVRARDIYGAISNFSTPLTVEIFLSNPPDKPKTPSGCILGRVGKEYTYTTITTDPDDDQLYYWWDWGDGSNSSWLGLYLSGENASANHKWTIEGSFEIRVKAKDINGTESPWSDPLIVTMPRNKIAHDILLSSLGQFTLLERLFSFLFTRLD